MDAKTRKKIEAVLDEAAELVAEGRGEYDAAREALTAQTSDVYRELAVAAIVDAVRRRQRSNVLSIEREAVRPTQTQERIKGADPGHRRRDRRAYWDWVEATDEGKKYESEIAAADAAAASRLHENLRSAMAEMTAALRIEWTRELLASEFALPDGTRVTWRNAAIPQHEARVAMYMRNAEANLEGAARHLKAVEELKRAGAPTLGDLVGVAA